MMKIPGRVVRDVLLLDVYKRQVLWNDRLAEMKEPLTERSALVEEYKDTDAAPFAAAESGCIDEVIAPERCV